MLKKLIIFSKAQTSAMIGGTSDYLIMIFFTEVIHLHYTLSIVIGGTLGAFINFTLNRKWAFHSNEFAYSRSVRKQLLAFSLVAINSIVLKILGTYFITNILHLDYKISRLVTDLLISTIFNFHLQKYWVFRKRT